MQYGCIIIFLVYPMFEYYEVRFTFTPAPLHSITADMLFNIAGHKIDDNYESWKYHHHHHHYRQPLCPVVGRWSQHAVSKLPCLVLSSALSRSSLHSWKYNRPLWGNKRRWTVLPQSRGPSFPHLGPVRRFCLVLFE